MFENNNILKSISILIDKKLNNYRTDKTFPSVVYGVNQNGTYTIIKSNQKYDVKCCIPNLPLSIGSCVYVKIPNGNLRDMHICGLR